MSQEHPGDLAAVKFATYVAHRNQAKELRDRASALRREAKSAALQVDAHGLRITAKACSAESHTLRASAATAKAELTELIRLASSQLVARMPPEYGSWGVNKTRAYMKLLALIVAQGKRGSPNLQLSTQALGIMRDHSAWTPDAFAKLAAIKGMPKDLG